MSLGPELITNGGFDTNTDWDIINAISAGWEIIGGVLQFNKDAEHLGSPGDYVYQGIDLIEGKTYRVAFTFDAGTAVWGTGVNVSLGDTIGIIRSESGTYTEDLVFAGDSLIMILMGNIGSPSSCSIDNVSVCEVLPDTGGINCTEREKKPVVLNLGKMKPDKVMKSYMRKAGRGR